LDPERIIFLVIRNRVRVARKTIWVELQHARTEGDCDSFDRGIAFWGGRGNGNTSKNPPENLLSYENEPRHSLPLLATYDNTQQRTYKKKTTATTSTFNERLQAPPWVGQPCPVLPELPRRPGGRSVVSGPPQAPGIPIASPCFGGATARPKKTTTFLHKKTEALQNELSAKGGGTPRHCLNTHSQTW